MNVLIAGCGYLGRALGAECLRRGDRVWGVCRSESSLEKVRAAGLEPVRADLSDSKDAAELPAADVVVACQAPARGESYEAAYLKPAQNLAAAVQKATLIFVSSTSVYGPRGGGWVEADTPIDPAQLDADSRTLFEAERRVLVSDPAKLKGIVVRLSGIYGPGRSRIDSIRSGRIRPVAGAAYTNRIHRDDAVAAILRVAESGQAGQTYLATDDAPATQSEFYGWLCPQLGVGVADEAPGAASTAGHASDSKRCSNAKLKRLGWKPKFKDYRAGYGALLEAA